MNDENEMIHRQITTPVIYHEGKFPYDAKSWLLKNRIIKFSQEITQQSGDHLQDLLLVLDSLKKEGSNHSEDITMYINSPGGSVWAGLSIYDTMQHISSDISTVCVGQAASMGSILLHAGTEGKRYALPNSCVMIHQIAAGSTGKKRDMDVNHNMVEKLEEKLLDIYVKHVPKDSEGYVRSWGGDPHAKKVEAVKPEKMNPGEAKEWLRAWGAQCDRFLDPEQAKDMGFIDGVIYPSKE